MLKKDRERELDKLGMQLYEMEKIIKQQEEACEEKHSTRIETKTTRDKVKELAEEQKRKAQ